MTGISSDEVFAPFNDDPLHQAYYKIAGLEDELLVYKKALELAGDEIAILHVRDGMVYITEKMMPYCWLNKARKELGYD